MSKGPRTPLLEAQQVSESLLAHILPSCEILAVAGSVRRGKPTVGDIEIVAVPAWCELPMAQLHMFEKPQVKRVNLLNEAIDQLVTSGVIRKLPDFISKWGSKYRNFEYKDIKIDLFQARADSFGLQLAIRTGPHEFSRRLVTQKGKGGMLPDLWRAEGGSLWSGPERISVPTEEALFDAIGAKWIDPKERG